MDAGMDSDSTCSSLSQILKKVLPKMEEDKLNLVLRRFSELGVETATDLHLLQESDLLDTLKPIQIRKLLLEVHESPRNYDSSSSSTSSRNSPSIHVQNKEISHPVLSSVSNIQVEIPFEKLPELRMPLENGDRLPVDLRRSLVREVVNEVGKVTEHCTKKQLEKIAESIVHKYRNSLEDRIDKVRIGTGYDSLLKQLISRNENLNRKKMPHRQGKSTVSSESDQEDKPRKKRKTEMNIDSYGCINWGPSISKEEEQRQMKMKQELKEMYQTAPDNVDWDKVYSLMRMTYAVQRHAINSGVSVETVVQEWPFIVDENVLLEHCKCLLGLDLRKKIGESYLSKAPRLISYFKSHMCGKQRELENYFAEVKEQNKMKNVTVMLPAVILGLMVTLGENDSGLFLQADEMSSNLDVQQQNTESWPRLAMLGESILAAKHYLLVVDGRVICRMASFVTALALLFGSYYAFNIEYPVEAAATLEFVQRCFVGINPEKGMKTKKRAKSSSVNAKVLTLINAIANFEWSSQAVQTNP